MLRVDLNCDMGEGYSTDAAIMPLISSANIACGYHAGDEDSMRRTVELALQYHVAIGAHPAYPDKEHFGRIDIFDTIRNPQDLAEMIIEQVTSLQKICEEFGTTLHHVKPHGALYNRAAKDEIVSDIICRAVKAVNPSLLLYGLSGSAMKTKAAAYHLPFISEVFADRTYREDGTLTPRNEAHALIEDTDTSAAQVLLMVKNGKVKATSGIEITIDAQTICIHGDGKHAVEFAAKINRVLQENQIEIKP